MTAQARLAPLPIVFLAGLLSSTACGSDPGAGAAPGSPEGGVATGRGKDSGHELGDARRAPSDANARTTFDAADEATSDARKGSGKDSGGASEDAGAEASTDCGMFPCFEDLYPHSPLLAPVPSNPPLDPDDVTIVATMFHRSDGLRASSMGGSFPLYSSACGDPSYVVGIGEPGWVSNQPAGQTVHFPVGAVTQVSSDHHISVFDACPATYGVWDFWSSSEPANGKVQAATGTRMPAYTVPAGCIASSSHYSSCAVDGLGSAEGHGGLASGAAIRGQEVLNGVIRHAILLGTMCSAPGNGIYPAEPVPSDAPCPAGGDSGPHARYGQRFYLALTDAQIDALFPPPESWKKVYWLALAHYGGYISDTGWVITQRESNNGYTALGKTSPWDTLAAANGWQESNGDYQIDFAPSDTASYTTIYTNIHAISVSAPPPVGP
jgi:hypothetical protein